jgi:hypothetical protein
MAPNDAIIPHRLLLQISALLESLPRDAAQGVKDEFGRKLPTVTWMNRRLRSCSWGELKKPAKFIGTR